MKHSTALLFVGVALFFVAAIHSGMALFMSSSNALFPTTYGHYYDFHIKNYWFCKVFGIIFLLRGLWTMRKENGLGPV